MTTCRAQTDRTRLLVYFNWRDFSIYSPRILLFNHFNFELFKNDFVIHY
jgi:hypothetical protein